MSLDDGLVFLLSPTFFADVRVEVVVPPLAALLADAPGEVLGDEAPVLGAVLHHEFNHEVVFFLGLSPT